MSTSSSILRTVISLAALSVLLFPEVIADRTTEAGEASITDPTAECTSYGYAPVSNALANFPTIGSPATILPGDTDAMAKWASIQGSVPNIAPKGTINGDFSSVHYTPDDPDCWWTFDNCVTPKAPGLVPDIATMPEPQTLGYGFDDGPNCSHNAFYDFLTSQNQKATMFYIGGNVMDFPLEAQRAIVDGHEICVHTWSHHYMTSFQSQDAFAELYYKTRTMKLSMDVLKGHGPQMQAIKLVTGVTPTCWRPPFGDVDDRIRAIAKGLGLRTIIWAYDSDDWQFGSEPNVTQATVDGNYQTMINDANNGKFASAGTIILAHELNNFTMSEAIKFHPLLKAAFKNIVPVGVGLNISQPYLETNYTLPSFAQYTQGITKLAANSTVNTAQPFVTLQTSSSGSPSAQTTSSTSNPPPSTTSTTTTGKSGGGSLQSKWNILWTLIFGLTSAIVTGVLLA